ncbi:styrene monooxygenase/indole monooxygenase family protein [Salinactinospora qingdaonensis]|uniref:Alanine-phosphoribitol ligase n=1 Tax=Salinactinospora qingdaonensis TaxID=702744 RepID=A0ABP7FUJ9_9ACTN
MRKVLVVGAGQSGLHLAHGLLSHDYDVTLITAKTSTEIRTGRPAVTQFTLPTVLKYEQAHHLDFWAGVAPRMEEFNVSLYSGGGPGVSLRGNFGDGQYAISVDRRVKMADWLEYFEDRGGKVVIHGVTLSDLDYFSRMFDLVVIAVGAGELGDLFDHDPNRFSGARPRVLTQAYLYDVTSDSYGDGDAGWVASTSNGGHIFLVPVLTSQGPCHSLFVVDKPGNLMDLSKPDRHPDPDEVLNQMKGVLKRCAPEYYERCKDASLVDGNSVLLQTLRPQVRKPVGTLPSGGSVLGIADVVITSDPAGGQGWNNSTRCAESYLSSILEHGDRPFDRDTLAGMFERFWEYGQHAEQFVQSIATMGESATPPEHFAEFIGAAMTYPEVADRWVQGWNDPTDYQNWLFAPDLTRAYLAEVQARNSNNG